MNPVVLEHFQRLLAKVQTFQKGYDGELFCSPTAYEINSQSDGVGLPANASFGHEDCKAFFLSMWEQPDGTFAYFVDSFDELGNLPFPTFEEATVAFLSILWARQLMLRRL